MCDTILYYIIFSVDTSDSDEQMDADEVVRPEQPDGAEGTADEHVHVEGVCVCASIKIFYC